MMNRGFVYGLLGDIEQVNKVLLTLMHYGELLKVLFNMPGFRLSGHLLDRRHLVKHSRKLKIPRRASIKK